MLSVHDNSAGMIEPEIKLNTLIFYGEAAFALGKFRKAEKSYSNALQYKKYLMKSKGLSKQIEGQKDILPDSGEYMCVLFKKETHMIMNRFYPYCSQKSSTGFICACIT